MNVVHGKGRIWEALCSIDCHKLSHVRQAYSRFSNVLSVIGTGGREMCTLHPNKVYCLPLLTYGCETWTLNDQSINRVNVAWKSFIFSGFWWSHTMNRPFSFFLGMFSSVE